MSGSDITTSAADQISNRLINRFIYIRLKKDICDSAAEIAAHSLIVLRALPGVVAVEVGIPADEHARAAWDFAIMVRFARLEDVALYHDHPEHRRYMDDYLASRMQVLKAWNFVVSEAQRS